MNHSDRFLLNPLVLSIASAFALTQSTNVQGACITTGSTMDCEGAITDGVVLESSVGALNLTVNSGSAAENAEIGPTANPGIRVSSSGTPAAPSNDALLNVPIPGAGVSGGEVTVNSYSTITTTGSGAHGISASSATSGYPSSVKTALQNFTDAGITFTVSSVRNPDGSAAAIGSAVDAKIAVIEDLPGGLKQFVGFEGIAGTFNIAADGTVAFDMGTAFDDLANGESRVVAVDITVDGYRSGVLKRSGETGQVVAEVTRNAATGVLEVTRWANFTTFGQSDKPQTSNLAWPDLNAYVADLVDQAEGAGGAGNSVTVNHLGGTITTSGSAAYGVRAESSGRAGSAGRNAGGFWTFGTVSPTEGGAGNNGGDVIVRVDGAVGTTYEGALAHPEQASIGVFAHSKAGDGGRGGDGSTWYGGRRGGMGGVGGLVEVFGSGTITTLGHNAIGIYALSEGGNGGNGGEGSFVNPAEKGGFGGQGGEVYVEGTWDITTGRAATDTVARSGDNAYGIWAKSVGGMAGSGGSGGWLAGASAGGGEGAIGGKVTLISGGRVETFGNDAFGLFGQSVGGFGGSGGDGGSIFRSRGASGESAGAGGDVTVTNQAGGEVITHGKGSHAVFSQSIGGGGGAGGGGSGIVGYGGSGGYGGTGGTVKLNNAGTVKTTGENARGLFAQSVGGGGGDGGDSAGVVAIGGAGSGTSNGGDVTLTNSGTVTTEGVGANAMFAQSIGGGGGTGGSSTGWFSIGGDGGGGGNAGAVKVTNSGTKVSTDEANATAIYAQSIGGGGGKGGAAISAGAFASMSIGGNGEAGGTGNTVTVDSLAGDVLTKGNRSYGIFAQSIGGGGGDGGYAVSGSVGVGASISIGVGGKGGGGGDADTVTVTNYSHIKTEGEDADGIFAESIGGGGGTGGFSISGAASDGLAITLNFGGEGGSGGDGKTVKVFNFGLIETIKDRSVGLQAQSVGGGGGRGGFSITGSGGGLGAFTLGVGGYGGSGGDASLVHVENSGQIDTQGENAHGLLAQSVGGGGGNGGFSIAAAGAGTGAATIGIGGGGGTAGNPEAVEVSNQGKISTDGNSAVALFAQSVGGGGGNGGFSIAGAGAGTGAGALNVGGSGAGGGTAKKVTVGNKGNLHTLGDDAHGLVAQSVGGGGGNGGFAIGITAAGTGAGTANIGGFGAGGGDGGWVDVTNEGAIDTEGDRSVALFAQSVGGGGGNGGFSIAGAGAGTGAGTLSLGGYAAGGGDADIVTVNNKSGTARLVTQGNASYGLLAQSVGGGGGNGGFSISVAGAGNGAGALSFGGSGGTGGDGKAVTVTNHGAVYTYGENSSGMFAQSVGGGGGSGGFSVAGSGAKTGAVSLSMGGSGGGGGDGDIVGLTNYGLVTTYGGLSYGIIAQSVGGGGGAGGFSFAAGLTTNGVGINASVGGSGGSGGGAAAVTLGNHGAVATSGEGSHGLVAQSVGGGGGSGGFSGSLTVGLGSKPDVSVSVGGSGDVGGDAQTVNLTNDAAVTTHGNAAYGMFAQSVGGGGGDGGGSLGAVLGLHDGGANLAVAIGGAGDGGGKAEKVTVGNSGTIFTSGAKAHAIVAQSVGGGGGNGGFSASGVVAKGTNAKDLSVSVGGSAGEGGNAGEIDLTNSGRIVTTGKGAAGIIAQSLGGGGGNGGFSFSGAFGGTQAKNLAISVGGSGGKGGVGKMVKVLNTGAIDTGWTEVETVLSNLLAVNAASSEDDLPELPNPPTSPVVPDTPDALLTERHATYTAYGIFAQSIGGGGGSGGTSVSVGTGFGGTKDTWNVNASVAVGGSAGDGNVGGTVDVTNKAAVTTRENDSHAIFAQSIGGGGGVGGGSITATIGLGAANTGRSYNGNLSIGGEGGSGNLGGAVLLDNQGSLRTYGDLADGIRAQSIGGGGGSGGSSRSINFLLKAGSAELKKDETEGANFKTQVSVGGDGGSGNDGGTVSVTNSAGIFTSGITSRGIFAQSVGGGGGSGGDGILGTGTAADSYLAIANIGLGSMGGTGNLITKFLKGQLRDLAVAVGGDEGASGDGATVSVGNSGAITTLGYAATAIQAQSVGGGGGEVNAFAKGEEAGGSAVAGVLGKIALGGAAGASGDGGAVSVGNSGALNTFGAAAHGIFAQSVGGGGGTAGSVERAMADSLNFGIGLDFARDGGSAGNGGGVTVNGNGSITTRGDDAYGIMAQSVGGGGGVASGLSNNPLALLGKLIGLAGSVGGHGSGGAVTVDYSGDITTLGYAAHGIFAQSAGGKTDSSNPQYLGVGGAVTVNVNGSVRVNGADGDGILAQSVGDAGAGSIAVNVDSGSVQGGSGSGAGVRFLDGAANTLTNRGRIGALSGLAVAGSATAETIENFGTIVGNVDLGGGANAFNNRIDSVFDAGDSVVVGAGRVLANAGVLAPGGMNLVQSTALTGNLQQTSTGRLAFDVSLQRVAHDTLNVTGTAQLAGGVQVKPIDTGYARPGSFRRTVLMADGGVSNDGLQIVASPSAVVGYRLIQSGANELAVDLGVDFAPRQLGANGQRLGRYINALQSAGGSAAFASFASALVQLPDVASLDRGYEKLGPGTTGASSSSSSSASMTLSDAMHSCRQREGDNRFLREGECNWVRIGRGASDQEGDGSRYGYDVDTFTMAGGTQHAVSSDVFAGFGAAYQRVNLDSRYASSDGDQFDLGAIVKKQVDATKFELSAGVGYGHFDSHRAVDLTGVSLVAESHQNVWSFAAHGRVSHDLMQGSDAYVRPLIDLGVTHVIRDGFSEKGAGGVNLKVDKESDTFVTLQPMIEIGAERKLESGTLLRPYARIGVTQFLTDNDRSITARLSGAPASVAPFTVVSELDRTYGDVSFGLDVLQKSGMVVRVDYTGQFSEHTSTNVVGVKFSMPF